MSLSHDIVVRNEFTYRLPTGQGTRGATPGNYVTGYMVRENAGEAVTPVRLFDADTYIRRYMARADASESAFSVNDLKDRIADAQQWGGQAFGYGSLSLSNEALAAASRDIQNRFDEGKTVLKTILSFDGDYLKQMGVVDEGFEYEKPGSYRGQVDQMKLRCAITRGLDRISSGYDDLRYVGVIQVDTAHVHCHLAMVDAGKGTIAPDGHQRGYLSKTQRSLIRRGIDAELDETHTVKHMSADVSRDRHNATCFIKKFTHKAMERNSLPQFLMACLPEDDRLWRAGSNRREMRKPNAIVREYVTDVLSQPNSGYGDAVHSIEMYARERQNREGLSMKEYRKLYDRGREDLIQDCMNGVYAVLRSVPKMERGVRTPMLDVMSEDYLELANTKFSDSIRICPIKFYLFWVASWGSDKS